MRYNVVKLRVARCHLDREATERAESVSLMLAVTRPRASSPRRRHHSRELSLNSRTNREREARTVSREAIPSLSEGLEDDLCRHHS